MHHFLPDHFTGCINTQPNLGFETGLQAVSVFLSEEHHLPFDSTPDQLVVFFLGQPESEQVNGKTFFCNFLLWFWFKWYWVRESFFWSGFEHG